MKKAIVTLIILCCLGLLGWRIYARIVSQSTVAQRPGGSRAVPVEVSPAVRRTMNDIAEFTGTLLPNSRFVVAPKIAGRLEKLLVNIGDTVSSGDQIAILDSAEYAQQVAQAEAELEVSKANLADSESTLNIARREYKRAQELREQRVASEAELDEAFARFSAAEAKYKIAEAQIKQREAALEAAKVRLSYTTIVASWEDKESKRVVAERFVDEGAMLRANDPIVSIVDLNKVLGVIYVIEKDFPEIRQGQKADIYTDAYPDQKFTGTVIRRAPVLQEESRQARVEIEIPNPERLLAAGMFIRCRIKLSERQNALAVPSSAIVRRNGEYGLFFVDMEKKKAQFIPVKTGVTESGYVQIIEPEFNGHVVVLGQHLLEDGSDVILPSALEGETGKGDSQTRTKTSDEQKRKQ